MQYTIFALKQTFLFFWRAWFSEWYSVPQISIIFHQPRLDAWDKCSDLVQWENLEGAGGEGGGRGDRDGDHM